MPYRVSLNEMRGELASEQGSAGAITSSAPVIDPNDSLTLNIAGFSTITNAEARETFAVAMQAFGDRMYGAADLLESDYRGDTSDVPQFTTRHIAKAEGEARDIEYRTKPPRPESKWLILLEVGHWVLTALLALAGGAWITTAVAKITWGFSPEGWGILTVVGFLGGIILTVAIRNGRKEPS